MMGYLDAWDLVLVTVSKAGRTDLLENLKSWKSRMAPILIWHLIGQTPRVSPYLMK